MLIHQTKNKIIKKVSNKKNYFKIRYKKKKQ